MYYDFAMLAILAYTTFRGAARGMAWQLAAIAALVLCFLFATPLSLVIAPRLSLDPPLNRWVAMLAIYLVFSFACFMVARMLRGWLETLRFEEYDRHLGAIFGFVKGATLCLVTTFFVVCLLPGFRNGVLRTTSGQLAGTIFHQLTAVMPAEVDGIIEPYLRRYDASLVADARSSRDASDGEDAETEERGARSGGGLRFQLPPVLDELLGIGNDPSGEAHPGTADDRPPADAADGEPADERARDFSGWLDLVSGLLADGPREQQNFRDEIEALLQGVPKAVAARILNDWQADLRGADPDPDPQTDLTTPLDSRIQRGLRAAGVAIESLPRPLRERLRGAEAP